MHDIWYVNDYSSVTGIWGGGQLLLDTFHALTSYHRLLFPYNNWFFLNSNPKLFWHPGERHLIIYQAGWRMRGSMLIPTCQSCSLVTSVILLIGGLLARRKANSLQRRMGFCFWKHLQEQLRMLRRWCNPTNIMSRLLYIFKWLDNRELWCEFWNIVINGLFLLLMKWISYNHVLQAFIKTAAKILQNIQEGALDAVNDVSHLNSCQIGWTSHFGIIMVSVWIVIILLLCILKV